MLQAERSAIIATGSPVGEEIEAALSLCLPCAVGGRGGRLTA